MSFTGGKLKLKGGLGGSGGVKKARKKKRKEREAQEVKDGGAAGSGELGGSGGERLGETPDGFKLPVPKIGDDRRTEAERIYDEKMNKREEDQVRRLAVKSHRERVKDFNEYLAKLTEHHDIPKVGPG